MATIRAADAAELSGQDIFEVEAIVDMRVLSDGHRLYQLQWLGYPGEDTWEPETNLTGCAELLEEFLAVWGLSALSHAQ
jgi:Chromo (CHRromatin Organisation MOdifier) domain